jgi:hypothetical protein
MRKLIIVLCLLLPFALKAQTDSLINAGISRMYNEITGANIYSVFNWMVGECRSDNSETGGEDKTDIQGYQDLMMFRNSPCNNYITLFWDRAYEVILSSNKVIADLPNSGFSSNEKKRIEGDAKFLRALMYFELTKNFGGVPIYTDTAGFSISFNNLTFQNGFIYNKKWFSKRNTIAEVYAQIKSDLDFCALNLPERSALSADAKFRSTKGAAKALLAKVYLYQSSYAKNYPGDKRFEGLTEEWGKALSAAEEVINSGQYSLVGSNGESYSTFWDGSYYFPEQSSGFRYIFSVPGNYCSESVFECKDDVTGWVEWGNNGMTHYTTCRYYQEKNGSVQSSAGWGFNVPTEDLVNEFKEESSDAKKDPRYKVTIGSTGDSIQLRNNWYLMNFDILSFPSACRKFECSYEEHWANGSWVDGQLNVKVIRYADLLLMASEAALNNGDAAKALTYINKVRQRARACGNTGYPVDLTSVTMNDIMHERRLELALEGHRFYDLVRWNLAEAKLNGRYNAVAEETVAFAKGINEFFPIPDEAIRASNGTIEQNSGYEQVCPYINGVNNMYIKSTLKENNIELDFSGNTLDIPTATVTTSNSEKATCSIDGKTLKIVYNNIVSGDSLSFTINVEVNGVTSLSTTFFVKVLDPVLTLKAEDVNFVRNYQGLYESKTDLSSVLTNNSYKVIGYYENGQIVNKYIFTNYAKAQKVLYISAGSFAKEPYLKGIIKDIENILVVFSNNTEGEFAIEMPVEIKKLFPRVKMESKQVAKGDLFSLDVTTSAIDTVTYSYSQKKYFNKLNAFTLNYAFDTTKMEFLSYDFENSLMTHFILDTAYMGASGLTVDVANSEQFSKEGKLVTLNFKAKESCKTGGTYFNVYFYTTAQYGTYTSVNSIASIDGEWPIFVKDLSAGYVKTFPNPVVNMLNVTSANDIKGYNIFDINGRLVLKGTNSSNILQINVSGLQSGLYFLKLDTKGSVNVNRFIKR